MGVSEPISHTIPHFVPCISDGVKERTPPGMGNSGSQRCGIAGSSLEEALMQWEWALCSGGVPAQLCPQSKEDIREGMHRPLLI